MAEAKQRDEWARTSSLMALIANANCDPKKHRAFRPTDFDPFSQTHKPKQKVDVSILKEIFIDTPTRRTPTRTPTTPTRITAKGQQQRTEAQPCRPDTSPTSSHS